MMRPIHYIKKYKLVQPEKLEVKFNHEAFAVDFKKDFLESINIHQTKYEVTLLVFDHKVKELHDKWFAISQKVHYGLPEQLWKFIYASIIIPLKIQMFPTTHNSVVNNKLKEILAEEEISMSVD